MIKLKQLSVHQGEFSLVGIDMTIPEGGYGILMGNTGSGKTTLLEAICGLRQVSGGRILLDQIDVTRMKSSARQIGYVPQDAVLFPTMRIDKQIGFGLEVRGENVSNRSQRVSELAQLLEIEDLLKRYPRGLSGGEKQRVALARALAFRPRLLCLDEPLSALDESTRTRLTHFLKTIHQEEKVTVLHITHSAVEAQGLGTVLFQLQGGQIHEI